MLLLCLDLAIIHHYTQYCRGDKVEMANCTADDNTAIGRQRWQ